ncbi:hypothetical protein [Methylocella sp.]|uniref:hypothetical protein n=1 Tax=Methylocella sp. TaxID=1978226 RepID=UPI003784E920
MLSSVASPILTGNSLRAAAAGVAFCAGALALPSFCGPAFAQTAAVTQSGGIAGTAFGNAGALAGATSTATTLSTTTSVTVSSATPVTRARPPGVVIGSGHIGAGTGGLGLGLGNAVGGIKDLAIGAGTGGLDDYMTRGSLTGGVIGAGRAFDAQTGGVKDGTVPGAATGGVQASVIGAGTGGVKDLFTLGASTGGTQEGQNFPRYRVVQ